VYRLLQVLRAAPAICALSVTHLAYTPQSITDPLIRYGDRPYAAALYARLSNTATDSSRQSGITTAIQLGIIGPSAGGEWMQREIHKRTGNAPPEGWRHQVKDDLILGFEIACTKRILGIDNWLSADGIASATLGSFQTRASTGVQIRLGYSNTGKLSGYFYYTALGNAIGYDASLQGGLLNGSSPYTIASSDIRRLTLLQQAGVRFSLSPITLSFFTSLLTKEFATGSAHSYSGLSISTRL
jgi:lipid A 3-O-deacylase